MAAYGDTDREEAPVAVSLFVDPSYSNTPQSGVPFLNGSTIELVERLLVV
jgi:hypothetical protein